MLTALEILTEAGNRAKVPGYVPTFGLRNLNAALSDICQHHDFALARGLFQFNFNPQLSTLFGSGPYTLPLDYLRTSGSSGATGASTSVWFLYPTPTYPQAQPLPLYPIDISEFDLFAKIPSQTVPELWCTDMGAPLTQRIVLTTTGDILGTDANIYNLASTDGLVVGQSCSGQGITPGSTILSINTSTGVVGLSANTTAALNGVPMFFGIAPVAYVYPPPLSNYPVTVRYQRQMPPIVDMLQVPWFPDEGYLITETAARLCEISDDARAVQLHQMAARSMQKYAAKADDRANRAQPIQLDPRFYGGGTPYMRAKNTKNIGW